MAQKKGFFADIADALSKEHWRAFGNEFIDSFRGDKWRKETLSYLWVIAGSILVAVGDVMFANPYRLAPGGTYGISNVLNSVWPWRISLYAACMDIPLLLIGTLILGPRFGVKTILSTFVILGSVWAIESVWGYDPLIHNGILTEADLASIPEAMKGLLVYPAQEGHLPLYFVPDYFLNTLVAGLRGGHRDYLPRGCNLRRQRHHFDDSQQIHAHPPGYAGNHRRYLHHALHVGGVRRIAPAVLLHHGDCD